MQILMVSTITCTDKQASIGIKVESLEKVILGFSKLLTMIEEDVQAQERTFARTAYESQQTKKLPTGAALFVDTPTAHCCFCQQQHISDQWV